MNASITGLDVRYPRALTSQLAEETGLPEDRLGEVLDLLDTTAWIRREGDVLWILGHLEYEPHVRHESAKVRKGVQRLVSGLPRLEIVRAFIAAHPAFFPASECAQMGLSWALARAEHDGKLNAEKRGESKQDRGIDRGIEGAVYETETNTRYDTDSDVPPAGGSPSVVVGTIPQPRPDSPASNWVAAGAEWWQANVGHITVGQFGKTCKPLVDRHGWDATFAGLVEWADERKRLNKDLNLAWFVKDSARWIEQAAMPTTNEHGDLTARGKRIAGMPA